MSYGRLSITYDTAHALCNENAMVPLTFEAVAVRRQPICCLPGAAAPGLEDFNETLLYSSKIVQS